MTMYLKGSFEEEIQTQNFNFYNTYELIHMIIQTPTIMYFSTSE